MNIFCFPYAGGSVFMYNDLKKFLSNQFNIIPIDYSGHGFRIHDKLLNNISSTIDSMYSSILKKDDGSSFALLGYSLGARLILLMYNKYINEPIFSRMKCIFFCAMTLQRYENYNLYLNKSNEEIMMYISKFSCQNLNKVNNQKVFLKILPIIKNDLMLFKSTDIEISKIKKRIFNIPVFILYSSSEKNINLFEDYFTGLVDYNLFDEGHFFIQHHSEKIARYISDCIKKLTYN